MMGSVFAMQGIGQFAAALIALICTVGFKESLLTAAGASDLTAAKAQSAAIASCSGVCALAVDKIWRIIIGFGAVPGCIALYYRLTIPETPRFTFDVARDVEKAGEDTKAYMQGKPEGKPDEIARLQTIQDTSAQLEQPKASFKDWWKWVSQWKNGKILLGTAGSWFFLDIAFYGLGLNTSIILSAINYSGGRDIYTILYHNAVGNLILVCAGAIPGYWVTVALCDTIGRKPIQFFGFFMLTVVFCVIGFAWDKLSPNGLLGLYIVAQFFFNFGKSRKFFRKKLN
jgi:MFS transporter, PHS family, inorganic phosphate transporter